MSAGYKTTQKLRLLAGFIYFKSLILNFMMRTCHLFFSTKKKPDLVYRPQINSKILQISGYFRSFYAKCS